MRSPLTFGQAALRPLAWPQAVETLGCIEVEIVPGNLGLQFKKFLNFRNLPPRSLYKSVSIHNVYLKKWSVRFTGVKDNLC